MNIIWLFLITTELTVVEARRNETRAAERRKLKRKKKQQKAHSDDVMLDEDQVIVAVSHDDIILVTSDEMIHVKSDSHTEDWEDQDECDNDRYEEEHGEGKLKTSIQINFIREIQADMVHVMIIRWS